MNLLDVLTFVVLAVAAYASILAKKLSNPAAATGWIIAVLVYLSVGYSGITMMATFFILATLATSIGFKVKQQLGIAERDKGKRTAAQVIANAGVAGLISILILLNLARYEVLLVMLSASLASATADTLSSELGNVYGRKFYNVLTFKKDKKGLDGVISFEGTLFGVAGSIVIAIIHAIFWGINISTLFIMIAGTIGNLADSYLGATLEGKNYLNNNSVNFLNTLVAAVAAYWMYRLL